MTTYRIDGFKFNRANIAGLSATERAGVNRLLSSRERDICTVETSSVQCVNGPFEGQTIELGEGSKTALLSIRGWIGYYEGGTWHGTTGQTVNVIADQTNVSSKTAEVVAGKGFTAFQSLLSDMAEDFSGRVIESIVDKSERLEQEPMDDYGFTSHDLNKFSGTYAITTHYVAQQTRMTSRGKFVKAKKVEPTQSVDSHRGISGNAYFMDDFGDLQVFINKREIFDAPYKKLVRRVTFTIGRTAYTVAATHEAVDNLRARIVKAKKWFSDKYIQAARPVQILSNVLPVIAEKPVIAPLPVEPTDSQIDAHIAALADQDVAEVVAAAQACAVIEQAQAAQTVETQELATVCEGETKEVQTMAMGHTTPGNNAPVAPHQMTAHEFGRQSTGNPHWTQSYIGKDDGDYLRDVALAHAQIVAEYTSNTPASHGPVAPVAIEIVANHAQHMQAAYENRLITTYGRIKRKELFQFSKTGDVYIKCTGGFRSGRGGPLIDCSADKAVWFYDTCMIQPAAPTRGGEGCPSKIEPSVAPITPAVESQPVAPAVETADTLAKFTDDGDGVSGELVDLIGVATKDQVQALTDSQFQTLYDHLENWNFHTENYLLEALRLGDDSIITEMQAIATAHRKASCLHGDIYERRNIVAQRMRDLKQGTPEKQAQAVPTVAQYIKSTPVYEVATMPLCPNARQQITEYTKPTVKSKSGKWVAWLLMSWDNIFLLDFDKGNGVYRSAYDTASDRMKALQALARAADAPDDTPPGKPTHEKPNAVQEAPAQAETTQTPKAGAIDAPGTATAGTDAGIFAVETAGVGVEGCAHSKTESAPAFEQVKPLKIDLADMLARGVKPDSLIGVGVYCSGDMANDTGSGAITAIGQSDFYGVVVDVTLEDGRIFKQVRTSEFKNGWFSLDAKMHGVPYLSQLAGTLAAKKAIESSAAAQKDAAHAKALIDLPAQYPQLKRAENTCTGGKLAATNIRILLKAAFKGVKFSVTSDYNQVRVNWTDGPASSQVEAITDKFDIGASDTQTDYFYTVSTAFSKLFGGVQYTSLRRNESDALLQQAIDQVYHDRAIKPTVSDYHKREGVFSWDGSNFENRRMREALNTTSKA